MTDTADLVKRLEPIMERLLEFYTPAEAVVWLTQPHNMMVLLGEPVTALYCIETGRERLVLNAIEMMEGQVAS